MEAHNYYQNKAEPCESIDIAHVGLILDEALAINKDKLKMLSVMGKVEIFNTRTYQPNPSLVYPQPAQFWKQTLWSDDELMGVLR